MGTARTPRKKRARPVAPLKVCDVACGFEPSRKHTTTTEAAKHCIVVGVVAAAALHLRVYPKRLRVVGGRAEFRKTVEITWQRQYDHCTVES